MTSTTNRANWILTVAVLVLLGASTGIATGLLSPLAAGLLVGAGLATALVAAGHRSRRT